MKPVQDALYYIFNSAVVMTWSMFLYLMLTPRFHKAIVIPLCTILQLGFVLFAGMLPESLRPVRSILPFVISLLCAAVMFEGVFLRKLFVVGLYFSFTIICEIFTTLLIEWALPHYLDFYNQTLMLRAAFYGLYVAMLLLGLCAGMLFVRKGFLHLSNGLVFSFFLFPLSQYVILVVSFWLVETPNKAWLFLCIPIGALCCIAVDLVLFRAMRKAAEQARINAEEEQLAQEFERQYAHYQVAADQYMEMRSKRKIDTNLKAEVNSKKEG